MFDENEVSGRLARIAQALEDLDRLFVRPVVGNMTQQEGVCAFHGLR